MRNALYAGSFDPLTNGHMWVIINTIQLFGKVTIAIAKNPKKNYAFTRKERYGMIMDSLESYNLLKNVEVLDMPNVFLVDFCKTCKCDILIRGVRNSTDFEYEKTMNDVNFKLSDGDVTTVMLCPPPTVAHISSSFVKGIVGLEDWQKHVMQLVPPGSYNRILKKYEESEK